MAKRQARPVPRQGWARRNRWLLVFLAVYLVLSVLLFDPKLSVGGDNAIYLILANSLVQGTGYRNMHLPEEPEHTQYPPGFPWLLSLLQMVAGRVNFVVDKVFVLFTGVAAMFFVYRICEHRFQKKGWMTMTFTVSVPMLVTYNHQILTEIPFLAVSMAAVYLLLKSGPRRRWFYWIAFACVLAGFMLRTAGIALVLGTALLLVLRRQYRYLAAFTVLFLLVFLPWQIRNAGIPGGHSYSEQFFARNPYIPDFGRAGVKDFAIRIGQNFVKYCFAVVPQSMLAMFGPGWPSVGAGAVLSGLTVLGFVLSVRSWSIIEGYFVFALAVLFGWPALWAGERFLLPLAPLVAVYIFTALLWLRRKVRWQYLAVVLAGVMVAVNAVKLGLEVKRQVGSNIGCLKGDRHAGYTDDWRRYFECIDWIRENIPKDKVVLARKPEFVYLLSGRKSHCYPFTGDRAAVAEAVAKSDYILFDHFRWTNLTRVFLAPVLKSDEDRFRYVFKTEEPTFFVLKARREAPP